MDQTNENNRDLIAKAMAKADQGRKLSLDSANEKSNVSSIVNHGTNSQTVFYKSNEIHIEKLLQKNNMLVDGSDLEKFFTDDYGRIKRPLLSNAFGNSMPLPGKGNFILVTSSIAGEGKTYTAINLALSIAQEKDHTVLLIDCDVIQHGASTVLGITGKPGLTDLLEIDDMSVSDVILKTDVSELCLISSGKRHDSATELFASKRMNTLMTEISERYSDRVIIFDGPPLLATPQAQVLSKLVGQVVVVIESGKTPQTIVEEALDMISEQQVTGLVMNKCEGIAGQSNYYYGDYIDE